MSTRSRLISTVDELISEADLPDYSREFKKMKDKVRGTPIGEGDEIQWTDRYGSHRATVFEMEDGTLAVKGKDGDVLELGQLPGYVKIW